MKERTLPNTFYEASITLTPKADKKLEIELPDDPTYIHKGIEIRISKRYLHPLFIAALFTIAKTWKQPKCALPDEWLKKMWYIHKMGY